MATTESGRVTGRPARDTGAGADETKLSLKTTEFLVLVVSVVAVLIATAASDSLNDVRAWTLIAVLGAAYMLSRGIAKAGSRHYDDGDRR